MLALVRLCGGGCIHRSSVCCRLPLASPPPLSESNLVNVSGLVGGLSAALLLCCAGYSRRCLGCFHTGSQFKGNPEAMEVIRAAVNLGLEAQKTLAVSTEQECYSYGQLLTSALQISSLLKAHCKTSKNREKVAVNMMCKHNRELGLPIEKSVSLEGARVGIMAKPCAEFVVGMWATWLCHAITVPLALSYPESELLHVLTDADVSIVLGTEEYQKKLEDVALRCMSQFVLLPKISAFDADNSLLSTMNEKGKEGTEEHFEKVLEKVSHLTFVDGDTPGLIVYTSGTTGRPKGVVHTHFGMSSQVKMLTMAWEYTSSDRFLHCLPLHHVHGLFNGLLAPLYAGAMVEFLPKFSVRGVWKRWQESYPNGGPKAANAVTVFTGVPTMYAWLLRGYETMDKESQEAASSSVQKLRLMMCGSSALPQPVLFQWEKLTGHRLLERYGMTEFVMALANPLHGERKPGTVGRPLQGVEAKIVVDDESAPGVGELCIKSPSMFKEYWRQPQITEESFQEDGYFKTGDSATVDDDGYYIILGRTSVDILKVGGYKLSALEIEAVLLEHPAIAECAILGLPDVYYGEVICAVVILTSEAKAEATANSHPVLTLGQLRQWAKERLAPYKIPTKLQIWEEMPRNAMGKVNKKELKRCLQS